MKPYQDIAREAAEEIAYRKDKTPAQIILAVIEKALDIADAEDINRRASQPKRSEQPQEWTPVYERNSDLWYVCSNGEPVIPWGFDEREAKSIADAHNAAVLAEQSRTRHFEYQMQLRIKDVLRAQAAIADVLKIAHTGINEGNTCNASLIYRKLESIDQSILDAHDRDQQRLGRDEGRADERQKRKPLVDALEKIATTPLSCYCGHIANGALAKINL